jgi:hypothetical protein
MTGDREIKAKGMNVKKFIEEKAAERYSAAVGKVCGDQRPFGRSRLIGGTPCSAQGPGRDDLKTTSSTTASCEKDEPQRNRRSSKASASP